MIWLRKVDCDRADRNISFEDETYLFQTQNNLNNIIYEDNTEEVSLVSAVHEFKEVMVSGIFSRVLHALQFLW